MHAFAARFSALLLALIALAGTSLAQFDSSITSRLRITPVTLDTVNLLPTPHYEDNAPGPVVIGTLPHLSRPATFVGTAHLDVGYFVQNRWSNWVDTYQAYTITTIDFGTNEKQFCTQVCGQVAWGTTLYAFPPFQGAYINCPPEPLPNCHIQPNDDWHYLRVVNDVPFTLPLWPGPNTVTADPRSGVTWEGEWATGPSHAYELTYNLHAFTIAGHLVQ